MSPPRSYIYPNKTHMTGDTRIVYMLEDDADDRSITENAVAELGFDIEIRFFQDSNGFLFFLKTAPKASLILIDYNSKPENGLEVLKKVKTDAVHSSTPTIILSDSAHEKYKNDCYVHGASSFIQKPSKVGKTTETIKTFFTYWLEVAAV